MLKRALNSVMNQTYQDFDVLVVDNDGTDKHIRALVESFPGNKIQYLIQPEKGVSAARNMGIENASSELIVFLDDDDMLDKNALREYTGFMLNDGHMVDSFAWSSQIKYQYAADGKEIECGRFKLLDADIRDKSFILKTGAGGLCVSKPDLISVGCFDMSYKLSEDRDLILKLLAKGKKFRQLDRLVYKRFYHNNERLSDGSSAIEEAEHDARLYNNHRAFIEGYPALKLRLMDVMAQHYFNGGKRNKAIEIAYAAWKAQPLRLKSIRRLIKYRLKSISARTGPENA